MKLKSILLTLLFATSPFCFAQKSKNLDDEKNLRYQKECEEIKEFGIKGNMKVNCELMFHHYNSDASSKHYNPKNLNGKDLKVAGINLLHPGQSKTLYKDFKIVAKLINHWDVVAAVELLPILGGDKKLNDRMFSLIESTEARKKKADASAIKELNKTQNEAKKLYRIPGYLKILNELRKLDPSWSLLISARGEAARETNVQELSGFYYRATVAKPKTNEYCKEYEGKGKAYGCIPSFSKKFMGKSLENVFSRRPFMASFESNKFDYTLLTTHVIFTSPSNPETKEHILSSAFGTDNLKELGPGINQANYARFAEVKVILDFMNKIRSKYSEKDVILVGDFNIEAKNKFWPEVLPSFPGGEVLVEEATSLKSTIIGKNGEEIDGYSSNYDHFLYDLKKTNECFGAQRYDYFRREISDVVTKKYMAQPVTDAPYFYMEIDKSKMKKIVNKWKNKVAEQKVIKRNRIMEQSSEKKDKIIENLKKRVFHSQLDDSKVLKVYKEIISDHAPIEMSCNTNKDDD